MLRRSINFANLLPAGCALWFLILGVDGFTKSKLNPGKLSRPSLVIIENGRQRQKLCASTSTATATGQTEFSSQASLQRRPQRPIVCKHLFRHYDDVSFDSWLRCSDPAEFLESLGYTKDEISSMASDYPPLLSMNVHSQLAPMIRFLVETMGGGQGELKWAEDIDDGVSHVGKATTTMMMRMMDEEEECRALEDLDEDHHHTMRVSDTVKRVVPPSFFGCRLDRTVGPRHAYLVLHNLPHGQQLLQEQPEMFLEFLQACDSKKSPPAEFAALCNRWTATGPGHHNGHFPHTAETVNAFERAFCPGLLTSAAVKAPNLVGGGGGVCPPGRLVELLVSHGSNFFEMDKNGVSPLHWAAGAGMVDGVRALLEAELRAGQDDCADLVLHEQGAKGGATPMHWASCGIRRSKGIGCGGSLGVCRLILEMAGERDAEVANAMTYTKSTPLMWAAWSGSLDVVELLVEHGADPHAQDSRGASAAHWAACGVHVDVCRCLHDVLSVDFTAADHTGHTSLDYAMEYNRESIANWIRRIVPGE